MNEFVRMYVSPINISANDTTPILMVRVQKKVPKVRRKNVIMTNIKMPHMNYCIHFHFLCVKNCYIMYYVGRNGISGFGNISES